jgi:NAD(P)H dehydrogenase (quinone)
MTILVYGATGTQGGPVARRLLDRGTPVRVVTRDPERAAALARAGAELGDADLADPASLTAVTKDVRAVFLQLPAGVAAGPLVEYARNALAAVREAGSPHLVLTTSSTVPDGPTGVAYADAKLQVAALAAELAPHAVVLRPRVYLDNLLGPLRAAIGQGVLPYPIPADVPVAWLTADDAAAFAVAALDRPELAGRRFDLATAPAMTGPQLAEQITAALGRPVRYQAITAEEFAAALAPALGAVPAAQIAEFYRWQGSAGFAQLAPDPGPALAALPITPTPTYDWLARELNRPTA